MRESTGNRSVACCDIPGQTMEELAMFLEINIWTGQNTWKKPGNIEIKAKIFVHNF